MKKVCLGLFLASLALGSVGCSSITGDVSYDQQKAKKDALQKVADENPDPNREQRPQ